MKRLGLFLVLLFTIEIAVFAQGYQVGDTASNFELKNIDGKIVSLSDFPDAKGYIIIFACDTCSQSNAYDERIVFIDNKYSAQGYPVVAIYTDNNKDIQKHIKEKKFTFPCLIDDEQKVSSLYGVKEVPEGFLLQKTAKGNIVRYVGTIYDHVGNQANNDYILDAADTMLLEEGKGITPALMKPVDSEIKIKKESTPELMD